MRTALKSTILIPLLFICLLAGANSHSGRISIYRQISNQVKFEQFARSKQLQGEVTMTFVVNELHQVLVKRINSANPTLKKYVEQKVKGLEIYSDNVEAGKLLFITFSYFPCSELSDIAPRNIKPYKQTKHTGVL